MAATTTVASPAIPPHHVNVMLDNGDSASLSSAAGEGRLEFVSSYAAYADPTRAALIQVTSGVLGFIAFFIAVPLVISTYLSRSHSATLHLQNATLLAFILANVVFAFAAISLHGAIHALAARALGGQPVIVAGTDYLVSWDAPDQGFARRTYLAVRLAPLVGISVLWLLLLLLVPAVAGYTLAGFVTNAIMGCADIWAVRAVMQQGANAVIFANTTDGFTSYAIAAAKPVRRKVTRPTQQP